MTTAHDLISGLAQSLNARDEETLAAIFAEHAIVRDGGLEYRGAIGVRRWIHQTIEKYALNLQVLKVSGQDREWLFDAMVSGTFEGSPVQLEHSLVIEDGKIANLDI